MIELILLEYAFNALDLLAVRTKGHVIIQSGLMVSYQKGRYKMESIKW